MLKGDISNEVPRRILVTYDYLTDDDIEPRKMLGMVIGTKTVRKINRERLLAITRFSDQVGVRCELVVFGADDDAADSYLQNIDRRMWHPFNYSSGYEDAYDLISDLPYRPEALGVMDNPERTSAYGSFAIDTDYLTRTI